MGVEVDKNKVLEEALNKLEGKINYSLGETGANDRDDLKQDIILRLIEATQKMEVISYSSFRHWWEENNS